MPTIGEIVDELAACGRAPVPVMAGVRQRAGPGSGDIPSHDAIEQITGSKPETLREFLRKAWRARKSNTSQTRTR
jgi:hypothetical protein